MVAALFTIAYLIWQPRTVDLAAHTFRADLFGQEGFTIWNGQWYGGHHTPAYSVLSPPLAWLLVAAGGAAVAAMASAALFPPLARGYFGDERARWGSIWFGAATATLLFTSRLPFAIGVAFGLAALLALQRRRYALAILFAVLCPLGSPVAGLFLAMAGVAYAIAERHDRAKRCEGLAIAAAAFLPPVFLSWAFPEGGWAPFPTSAYVPIPLFALACSSCCRASRRRSAGARSCTPRRPRSRSLIETPMGGNAVRLGALFGGPVLLCAHLGPAVDARSGRSRSWPRLRLARAVAVVARGARREEVHRGPGREGRLLPAAARVPVPPARPAPDRDPVHALPLGGRRGRDGPAARARLAAPARHRA